MPTAYTEFKGRAMLALKKHEDDEYPLVISRARAKLIMENFEAIKKFAEDEDEKGRRDGV